MVQGSKSSGFSRFKVQVLARALLNRRIMAKDFTELIAWQRADELDRFMLEVIKRPSIARDKEFCKQTSDAAGSAPRNIAEGFGRFAPIQFANFLRIAIGSEKETKNQILKAWQRGAITDQERNAGLLLARRAVSAATGLRALQPLVEGPRQRQANRGRLRPMG